MRRLASLVLIAALLPLGAGAQGTLNQGALNTARDTLGAGGGKGVRAATAPASRPSRADAFVDANISETLYHELGHALIDVLDLPVFGPEEFAADYFAIVMINRLHDEQTVVQMTYDVAAAYDAGAVKEARGDEAVMWDVHGTDRQRYFNLACNIYGANPEARDDLATELGLPEARADTCEDEFRMADRAWGSVLDRVAKGAPGDTIKLDWVYDPSSRLAKHVTADVDQLNAMMVLPEPVTVSVISCDEANAYYDPATREITICTEIGDYMARLAERLGM